MAGLRPAGQPRAAVPTLLFFLLLQIRGLVRFRLRFGGVRFPRKRVRGRGRVHAEVPHIEVDSFFSQSLGHGIFARRQRLGGGELDPASGHGGDRGGYETFVGFHLSGYCDLDRCRERVCRL